MKRQACNILLPIIGLILLNIGCNDSNSATTPIQAPVFCLPEALKASTIIDTVQSVPLVQSRTLTGEVTYNADNKVEYVSLVNGTISQVRFTLGDFVKRGQVLGLIQSVELTSMYYDKQALESKLPLAIKQATAEKELFQNGLSTEKQVLEAETEIRVIQNEIAKIRINMAVYESANEPNLFKIKAPADGYIVQKNISSGSQVTANGAPLFVLSDVTTVWVTANVYTTDVNFIHEGMEVTMRSDAYENELFQGTISSISQIFDQEEKVLKARIIMQNKNLRLKPGMFVEVQVKKATNAVSLAVPDKAIVFHNNQQYLLVYESDCSIQKRKILPGSSLGHKTYIESGVAAGEKIITNNQLLIFEAIQ